MLIMIMHDYSLTPAQMAKADLLGVIISKDRFGFFPVREHLHTGYHLLHKQDNQFRWWPDAEAALKVAANPAKYDMYWP